MTKADLINIDALRMALKSYRNSNRLEQHPWTKLHMVEERSDDQGQDIQRARARALKQLLYEAIDSLKAGLSLQNPDEKSLRPYLILHGRYIEGKSPMQLCADLYIQRSTLFLEQRAALNQLLDTFKGWEEQTHTRFISSDDNLHQSCVTITRQDAVAITKMLLETASVAASHAQRDKAEFCLQESVSLGEQIDDRRTRCQAVAGLGFTAFWKGECARGQALIKDAITLAQSINDDDMTSQLLAFQGFVAVSQGEYEQGIRLSMQSLDFSDHLTNSSSSATAMMNIGKVAFYRGEFSKARSNYDDGVAYCLSTNDEMSCIPLILSRAELAVEVGECTLALDSIATAHEMARRNNYRLIDSPIRICQGRVLMRIGQTNDAAQCFEEGLKHAIQASCPWHICNAQCQYGQFYLLTKQFDSAHQAFQDALATAQSLDARDTIAEALFGLAKVNFNQGNWDMAFKQADQSLSILCRLGHRDISVVRAWLKSI